MMNMRRFLCIFTWITWRFEQVDPCELLIPLVSFETENKSVFGLLLLRTGLISLQFPFFSLSLSLWSHGSSLQWWIHAWIAGNKLDDDDYTSDHWEFVESENIFDELQAFDFDSWKLVLIFMYLAMNWWICDGSGSNLWGIGAIWCLLRWFQWLKKFVRVLLGWRVRRVKRIVTVFWWVGNECVALWWWCVVFIADMCPCNPVESWHLDWTLTDSALAYFGHLDLFAILKLLRTDLQKIEIKKNLDKSQDHFAILETLGTKM
jgi:hypothetical protein